MGKDNFYLLNSKYLIIIQFMNYILLLAIITIYVSLTINEDNSKFDHCVYFNRSNQIISELGKDQYLLGFFDFENSL